MLPYQRAQHAISELKSAAYECLANAPDEGLTNAELGRSLGIYMGHDSHNGHVSQHEGHVSRAVLGMLAADGVAEQSPETKRWKLICHFQSKPGPQ